MNVKCVENPVFETENAMKEKEASCEEICPKANVCSVEYLLLKQTAALFENQRISMSCVSE